MIKPKWNLRNIEEKVKTHIEYSTQAARDVARESGMEGTLKAMVEILNTENSFESLSLELKHGHAWRISHNLGLRLAEFVCPGGEGDHSDACRPPQTTMEDVSTLLRGPGPEGGVL